MQRASVLEPADNLVIVSGKVDDLYSRKQAKTALGEKQVVTVLEQRIIGKLFLIVAARPYSGLIFHQRCDGKRRFALWDVLQPHKLKEVRGKLALRIVKGAVAVGEMDPVFGPPMEPLLKHAHDVAAVLMQAQQKLAKCAHAAQEKVAQLLEEFAIEVRQRSGIKAGENFRMRGNDRVIFRLLPPAAK